MKTNKNFQKKTIYHFNMKQLNGEIGGKNLRSQIKKTEHFKNMSRMLQKMFLTGNNIKGIVHALRIIENTSFDSWKNISNYRYNSVEIIKELTK